MPRSLRPREIYPTTTRWLHVLRVRDASPGMRRVTLGGEKLQAHTAENGYPVAAFRSDGFDDEFKIMFKHPEAEAALGPEQRDGVLHWPLEDPHLVMRTYTVRRWDAEAAELDIDFVLHGVGPATSWARHAQPGDRVQIAGPRQSGGEPEGADWLLVAGDETALPAIARWLEEMPQDTKAQVFIEVGEQDHRQELVQPPGVEITWLSRDGAEAGTTTLLQDAITSAQWWEGAVFAWVAGEALSIAPIRRWLTREKQLPKEQVEVTGYWRRSEVVVSEENPELPDFEATVDVRKAFHDLAEIAPGLALRTAATIGLGPVLAERPRTIYEAAAVTGADRTGLFKLLRYLASIDVVEKREGGAWALTVLGHQLDNDFILERLDLSGHSAQRDLGLLALTEAVRTGTGDVERWFGTDFGTHLQRSPGMLRRRLESEADQSVIVTGALAEAEELAGHSRIAVLGRAPGAFARDLVKKHPGTSVTVTATPAEIEILRQIHPEDERIDHRPGSILHLPEVTFDIVLVTGQGLHSLPETDAVHALEQATSRLRPGGKILILGRVLDEQTAHDHDYEDDLVEFALHGGGLRTADEQEKLFARAGLVVQQQSTVGWGFPLRTLRPSS